MRKAPIALLIILAIALFLRVYGLADQGLLFADEGTFIYRAKTYQILMAHDQNPLMQAQNYADKKVLWLCVVLFLQNIFPDSIIAVQGAAVFFGLLTVILTYVTTYLLYHSRLIALFSSGVLALSSYHIFYSRLAMPETMCMFFVLAGFYLYLRLRDSIRFSVMPAAVMTSFAFLSNVFRMSMMPIFIGLIELCSKNKRQGGLKKYLVYLGMSAVVTILLIIIFNAALAHQGVLLPPYLSYITSYVQQHSVTAFDLSASLYCLTYLFHIEGLVYFLIFLAGFFFLKSKHSTQLPLACVVVQMSVWFFIDEKASRALSPALPFVAMSIGVTLFNFRELFRDSFSKDLLRVVLVLLIINQVYQVKEVLHFKSDVAEALDYINEIDHEAKIITSTEGVALAHDTDFSKYHQLTQENVSDVRSLAKKGFNYLMLDFVRFTGSTLDQADGTVGFNSFVSGVHTQCTPMKEFSHFNLKLQQWMFMEVNHYLKNIDWLRRHLDESTGVLQVYDLNRCLERL